MNAELSMTDTLISQIAGSALTLAYAQDHIRALGNTDANLITVWIDAAASYFEEQTGRQLLTATREVWLDAFPFVGATGAAARIELPHPPLKSVVSITYLDGDGVLQTLTDGASPATNLFNVSMPSGDYCRRGWVEPLYGSSWPTPMAQTGAVRIRYTCGYGDSTAIPALIQGILCFLIGHFDTNRSAVQSTSRGESILELPLGVKAMMDGYKYSALPSQILRTNAIQVTAW